MKTQLLAFMASFMVASLFNSLQAQDGSLDFSFGTNGKVTTAIGSGDDEGKAIAIQSDGKILVAGYSAIGANRNFALLRYNTDGSLDISFDTDGKVTTDFGSAYDEATAISIQSDGKILLAGHFHNGGNFDFALARYNTDGSLDTSFNANGKVITAIGTDAEVPYAIALQSDGKILVVGYSVNASTSYDFVLVRYNIDGSIDTSFDTDGIVTTAVGSSTDVAYAISIQADGKILLAGDTYGAEYNYALVRYNSDGSLDTSFDTDGIVTTTVGSSHDQVRAMRLQSDGKIVLAGNSTVGANIEFAVVRYNVDGSLDTSFDTDGKVTTTFGGVTDLATTMEIQPNGKIVLAGRSTATNTTFAMARYNTNGSLDNSFDADGKVTTAIGTGITSIAYAISLQSDGKILLAGTAHNNTNNDFALARYNNNITSTQTIADEKSPLLIYPNPFNNETTIQFPSTTNDAELNIYNIYGQKVKTISNISDSMILLNRNELASGFYVISLTQDKKVVAVDRMIVVD